MMSCGLKYALGVVEAMHDIEYENGKQEQNADYESRPPQPGLPHT